MRRSQRGISLHSYGECSNYGPVMEKTEMSEIFFARSEKSKPITSPNARTNAKYTGIKIQNAFYISIFK
jgi:hypothetical protein